MDIGDTMTGTLSINKGINFNQLYFYDENGLGHAIHCGSNSEDDYADFQIQTKTDVGRTLLALRNKKTTGDNPTLFIYNDANGTTTSYQVLTQLNYHNYALPKSGGTLTGILNTISDKYFEKNRNYAINMNNSDIININSLYFKDTCDTPTEGIHFWGGTDIFDTLYSKYGTLYYSPQRAIDDTAATSYRIITSAGGTVDGAINFNSTVSNMLALYPNETVTSGTTAGTRTSLLIYGPTYGNTAANMKEAGRLNWGDPNPQIVFNYSNTLASGQPLALMYSDNNSVGWGTTLALVSSETTCGFVAPYIRARASFQVIRDDATPAAGTVIPIFSASYQNTAGTYYNPNIINLVGTGETANAFNPGAMIGCHGGSLQLMAGECGPSMCSTLGLYNTENIYMTCDGQILQYVGCANDASSYTLAQTITSSKITAHVPLYGAVWNDYAEYRAYLEKEIPYGKVVIENGDDTMRLASGRMEPGAMICSDTFGFAIGETDECKMPVAVSGRVLAYPYEGREVFKKNIGKPVCSGPNGTVSIMSDEEYKEKGYCSLGVISAVPDYEVWGSGNVAVNGRVWISVK